MHSGMGFFAFFGLRYVRASRLVVIYWVWRSLEARMDENAVSILTLVPRSLQLTP